MSHESAEKIIETLRLLPHPEGGWYRETWRHAPKDGSRGAGTAIFFLLQAGQRSAWHKVDAAEMWHFYAGAPLQLDLTIDGAEVDHVTLGPDVLGGQTPQALVPPHVWQAAESLGAWTLVGCTVSPAFEFQGFELGTPPRLPR